MGIYKIYFYGTNPDFSITIRIRISYISIMTSLWTGFLAGGFSRQDIYLLKYVLHKKL
jgi:hypothetical protein